MKNEFANLSNEAKNGEMEAVLNMEQFFEDVRKGDYSLPKPLRGLFILAVNNSDAKTLTVRVYERPTGVEGAIRKYRLRGINVELETDIENSMSVFDRSFKIMINVRAFLSNLNMFYKTSKELLEQQGYRNEIEQGKVVRKQGPEQKLQPLIIYRKKIV